MLFGAAALRIQPAVSRVVNGLQSFKLHLPALELSVSDYQSAMKIKQRQSESHHKVFNLDFHVIRFDNISFKYPHDDRFALKEITFEILQGKLVSFVGRSGSGKPTLGDVLLGLLEPTEGRIQFLDKNLNTQHVTAQVAGFVSQQPFIMTDSFVKNVTLKESQTGCDKEICASRFKNVL